MNGRADDRTINGQIRELGVGKEASQSLNRNSGFFRNASQDIIRNWCDVDAIHIQLEYVVKGVGTFLSQTDSARLA